ncbi:two-component system response regulator [Undibacterium macrobrachii]|jgi:diguanylate cyclase (GGDEF)-like protein/PAS domain S-box-containing protein|uniref:Uncharacterized protein n=1 Tax=Undibacterium macrobrachii TaxID=1119058 RepID=A0ABQ2XBA6_9BURK|nr:EAL domain-containing protein [Undibacterium macrobrachii]GGX08428.1 hypothetical protein GCM10011282_13140 [Undibacterium macrobrachii]
MVTKQSVATILIVDDQPSNVLLVHEIVRDLGEVLFANSGPQALQMVQRVVPDLILMDIEMPGMDGLAVCEAIKADPLLADVAVIFITSHHDDSNQIAALNLGGVDFLTKPLNLPVARARIETHLSLRRKSRLLDEVQRDLRDIVHNLPAFISQWDEQCRNVFSNDLEGRWFDISAEKMPGLALADVIGDINFATVAPYLKALLEGFNPSFDIAFIRANGQFLHGQVSFVRREQDGQFCGFLMLMTDVTARKQAELALHDEKERIRITLNSIGDAVIATDDQGIVTFLNPIAEEMTGWLGSEAIGLSIELVMPLREGIDGHVLQNPIRIALKERRIVGMALNCTLIRRDGMPFEVEDSAAPIRDHNGKITGTIIVFHDVSEARAMAVKMTHLANHDALTNLPNRMLLRDRTEQALATAKRESGRVALAVLDLDHFKTINDSIGHTVGDHLLQQIAIRLKSNLREIDTISRQGGDEFVILSPRIDELEIISTLADRLLKAVAEPFFVDGNRFDLSASIGISIFPDDSDDMESLYRHADGAMFRAKQEGRNRVRFFSAEIEDVLKAHLTMTRQIRAGLEDHEFEVHYQPKLDVRKKIVVGVEALVRWRNQDGQLVSPAYFIPAAEQTGLIIPLGKFVLKQACLDGKKWHQMGYSLRIAVNVSVVQMMEGAFIATLREIVDETQIDPRFIEIEITESILAGDATKAQTILEAIREVGATVAIDDFGTGYSSLTYLKSFPVDVLKIDQSFVRDMMVDRSDAGIVEAIVQMAKSLSLRLVAEGVETRDQADTLLGLGCDIMQGYLFARPMPASQIDEFLTKNND